MSQTDYAVYDPNPRTDRTVMHVLYAMHTVGPFTFWLLPILALIVNYIRRGDETDPLWKAHHDYMIRTFWWAILWLVLSSPLYLLFVLPGVLASTIVGFWYLYRCIRGWLRFNDQRLPT